MSEQRVKLDTAIEREVHRLVRNISEGVYDRMQLYVRSNNLPVEPDVLTHILKTVQVVISEFELKNIDAFHANIKRQLDDYVGDENPTTQAGDVPATTPQSVASKKRRVEAPLV